jgi:polysaccharide export outer membrane protein
VGEPLMSETVTVNERGQVPLPKIGTFDVTPFSLNALEDTLRARYAQFLRTPAIEVQVLRRLTVGGEVIRPNVYYVDVATTLRDAIAVAGGMTENAKRDKVYIVRDGARIDIPEWQSNESRIAELRSGDQVMVGRKSWFAINALGATTTLVVVASLLLSLKR